MYYLINGECSLIVQDCIFNISSGTIVFIPPDTIHKTTYTGTTLQERLYIEFTSDYLDELCKAYGNNWPATRLYNRIFILPLDVRSEVNRQLDKLIEERHSNDTYSKVILGLMFQEFLIKLLRINQDSSQYLSSGITHIADDSVQKAFRYISNNYQSKITLDDVAMMLHLNASYFSKKFKTIAGIGFKEYLNTVRINHSEKLLLETDKSITEIAFECGYDNSNYFGDAFKRLNKISPTEFRKIKGNVTG